jgi:hypothetical protein
VGAFLFVLDADVVVLLTVALDAMILARFLDLFIIFVTEMGKQIYIFYKYQYLLIQINAQSYILLILFFYFHL